MRVAGLNWLRMICRWGAIVLTASQPHKVPVRRVFAYSDCLPINMSLRDIVAEMTIHKVALHKLAPPVPRDDKTNSTLMCLPLVPRSMRHLRRIEPISQEEFTAQVKQYVEDMPELYPTRDEEDRLRIPTPATDRFRRDKQIRLCLDNILEVLNAIMTKIDPTIAMHDFDGECDAPLHCGWSNVNWGHLSGFSHGLAGVDLVTVALPMWCFANKDMNDFTAQQQFVNPSSLEREDQQNLSSATRLWARLYDFCHLHGTHYFVVSTYDRWAFGAFSAHWTAAYVTPPVKFDATAPNIVQSMLFWMHSSVGHPKGYTVTKIRETASFLEAPLYYVHQAVLQPRAARRLACCS